MLRKNGTNSDKYFRNCYNNFHKNKKRKLLECDNLIHLGVINDICTQKNTAEEQIPLILAQIEAKETYYTNVHDICLNLKNIVQYFYKGQLKEIRFFGSAFTTLALKNSDVDIFLDFGDQLPEPPVQFLKSLKNKIKKTGCFGRSIAIVAKVPIVQCIHIKTGILCDISFTNGLGVANSNLIKFFLSLDERIRPLILILKCLFKKEGLIGSNAITSFSLIMLIIFFLQNLDRPLIPVISYLQQQATTKNIIAGWDTSFSTKGDDLSPITNADTIIELLRKFFKFYATFEFGLYVISSFTAKAYLKPVFENIESLPDEFNCYKENIKNKLITSFECNKFMCVQDSFNHSHNLTRSVVLKTLQRFQMLCEEKMNICPEEFEENKSNDFRSVYFKNLFSHSSVYMHNKIKSQNMQIQIYIGNDILFMSHLCTEDDLRNQWSQYVLKNVKDILIKVMKCNVTLTFEADSTQNDDISKGRILEILSCELLYFELISKKRNCVREKFLFPTNLSAIDEEEILTNFMCETNIKEQDKISLKFLLKCFLKTEPTSFCIEFIAVEQKKGTESFFNQIFKFMSVTFPRLIK